VSRADHDEFDGLAVGWALHGLEPGEEHAFVEHLSTCDRCQITVRESEEALGELAYDVPLIDPSPELLNRIRKAAGDISVPSTRVMIPPVEEPGHAGESPPPGRPGRPVAPVRWLRVPRSAAMSMAAAIVLIALLSWNVVLHNRAGDAQRVAAQRRDVIAKMAGSSTRAALLDSSSRTVGYVQQRGVDVQVVADGMPVNDRKKTTYVLWAVQGSGRPPVAVGTFDVVRSAVDVRPVDGQAPYAGFSAFAVSKESGRAVPDRPSQVVATGLATGPEPN